MNPSRLLLLHAMAAMAAGVVLRVAPAVIPGAVGIHPNPAANPVCHLLGAAGIGLTVLSFSARQPADRQARQLVCLTCSVFHGLAALVDSYASTQGRQAANLGRCRVTPDGQRAVYPLQAYNQPAVKHMKLIVFGATGGTGAQVVEQALQAGHQVTALVRQPAAFPGRHPQLTVLNGDVLQPAGFATAFQGADAIISCLGTHKREPTAVYSDGVANMIRAMQETGVTRIICVSAIAVEVPPRSSWLTKLVTRHVLQRLIKHPYADMLLMEDVLR